MFKRKSPFGGGNGGKKFGGFKSRGFGDRDARSSDRYADRPQLHAATCAGCGRQCEVPFRPNGSKPTYCSACFKKESHASRDKFVGGGFGRPNFGEKRPYDAGNKGNEQLEKQLAEVNVKLDRILREIEALKEKNG